MENNCNNFNENSDAFLDEIIDKFNANQLTRIEVLQEIQNKLGYVPKDAVIKVADNSNVPLAEFYGILTFYSQFKMEKPARFKIEICMGTACYVKGAQQIYDYIRGYAEDKNKDNETLYTIDSSRCLGCCGIAPVMKINDKIYGNLTLDKVKNILQEMK